MALLIVALVTTPVIVATSHDHQFFGGDGRHTIQSHTCSTKELHRDLHASDTCLACLRAGLFVASFPAIHGSTSLAPVCAAMMTADRQLMESEDLACPERGPPFILA